jgi:hypothetical protein
VTIRQKVYVHFGGLRGLGVSGDFESFRRDRRRGEFDSNLFGVVPITAA